MREEDFHTTSAAEIWARLEKRVVILEAEVDRLADRVNELIGALAKKPWRGDHGK